MQRIKFMVNGFVLGTEAGVPKFEAGKDYPVDDETLEHVASGNAELIDVPEQAAEREVVETAEVTEALEVGHQAADPEHEAIEMPLTDSHAESI